MATLFGALVGKTTLFLLFTTSGLLSWYLYQLYLFSRWIESPKQHPPPASVGIWDKVERSARQLRERGRKRKRKIGRMLTGFRESTSALPDATVVIDDNGHMEWWNSAAKDMLGLEGKSHMALSLQDVVKDPVFHAFLSAGDYSRPLQMPAPVNESISLEVRIVPYGKGKRLFQARDISRMLQLETVRRDFVANVSHEMRTPLTVIHGYLETISETADEALAKWRPALDQMGQQTGRMQRIVEDLLVLSRLESDQQSQGQEVVDVPLMLESLYAEAATLSNGQHQIELILESRIKLYGNLSELESAFSNIVFNAIRYTPKGGSVKITWRKGEEGACFVVQDTGIGIAAEHLPRLTERFYRVDVGRSRQGGGTGLGLAIVKHVLIRHGGKLEIESDPGRGSTFSCRFPVFRGCD